MRRWLSPLPLLLLALAGCSPAGDPAAYRHPFDRVRAALHLQDVIVPVCYRRATYGGVPVLEYIGEDQCFRFAAPRRMHGIWRLGFEFSMFWENGDAAKPPLPRGAWLRPPLGQAALPAGMRPGAYEVELIGRSNLYPGHFGHMGLSPDIVLADRILSLRPLPAAGSR